GGPTLFHDLTFGLDLDSRFAIVGPNGIGKSTLLGLISGHLQETSGRITRNPKVRLAIFSQHHVDGMDLALTPLAAMQALYPLVKDDLLRGHLASFGLPQELAEKPMYQLSGGQKNRVAFAKMTWTKPHILLLDEPSNHLDIDACNALIEGLATFKGGVLMVSHDQYLIEATVDELWMCEGGSVRPWRGTFMEYKATARAAETTRNATAANDKVAVANDAYSPSPCMAYSADPHQGLVCCSESSPMRVEGSENAWCMGARGKHAVNAGTHSAAISADRPCPSAPAAHELVRAGSAQRHHLARRARQMGSGHSRLERKLELGFSKLGHKIDQLGARHTEPLYNWEARHTEQLDKWEARHTEQLDKLSGQAVKHMEQLDKLNGQVVKHTEQLDKLDNKVYKMGVKLDKLGEKLDAKFDKVDAKFDKLGEKVDANTKALEQCMGASIFTSGAIFVARVGPFAMNAWASSQAAFKAAEATRKAAEAIDKVVVGGVP
ncbi:hypothetical protein QJQ45_022248, partial [Haematococcus lacustris]